MSYLLLFTICALLIGVCLPVEDDGGGTDDDDAADASKYVRTNSGTALSDSAVARYVTRMLQKLFRGNIRAKEYKPRPKKKIKCPSDLNCNFQSHNGSCNWHNVENDGGRGSTNLLLGLGRPQKGNMNWTLIMGSEERPNPPFGIVVSQKTKSTIWWVSNPIPKQPGDGTIKLRAWISPQISMKVCARLYDPRTSNRKKPLTFFNCSKKLHYDITPGPHTLTVRGPIKEPFELVMVFGPFPLKQGGLIVIDDITYKSDLC